MTQYQKNSHCGFCGHVYHDPISWPRSCLNCAQESYRNPTPVIVVLQPVIGWYDWGGIQYGLLIQKRGINPEKGKWALTGGYIEHQETWEDAAVRETKEELGLETKANLYKLWSVESSTSKDNLLIFVHNEMYVKDFQKMKFEPNNEVSEIGVMWEPMELAFPAHTKNANEFLNRLKLGE